MAKMFYFWWKRYQLIMDVRLMERMVRVATFVCLFFVCVLFTLSHLARVVFTKLEIICSLCQAILYNDEAIKKCYLRFWLTRAREKLHERQLGVGILFYSCKVSFVY